MNLNHIRKGDVYKLVNNDDLLVIDEKKPSYIVFIRKSNKEKIQIALSEIQKKYKDISEVSHTDVKKALTKKGYNVSKIITNLQTEYCKSKHICYDCLEIISLSMISRSKCKYCKKEIISQSSPAYLVCDDCAKKYNVCKQCGQPMP